MSQEPLSDLDYVGQLGAILRQQDPEGVRAFLVSRAADYGDENQAAELRAESRDDITVLMHRMTLARSDLEDLHTASRAWLVKRGLGGPTGGQSRRN